MTMNVPVHRFSHEQRCVALSLNSQPSTLNPQLSTALAQGPLTPPGAAAPTMKTLDQLEPRTPISTLPFTISSPGSYYVTSNLTGVAGQHGITINADNVTLDLGGFERTLRL